MKRTKIMLKEMANKNWILICLAACFLTGCWDKVEIENRAFVVSVGIDKFDNGDGEKEKNTDSENRYKVYMSVPNVSMLVGNDYGDEKAESLKIAEGKTVLSAMHEADSYSSQQLFFGQTKLVVLGEDLLRDEELFRGCMDAMERNAQISRKSIVLAADGDVEKILDADIPGEPLVGLFVSNFFKNNSKTVATVFREDLENILCRLRADGTVIIPKISLEEKEIKLGGAAIIKDFELVGWMDEEQVRGYLWFLSEGEGAQLVTEFKNAYVPMQVSSCKRNLSFYEQDGKIICRLELDVSGHAEEFKLSEDMLYGRENTKELQKQYENIIAEEVSNTFSYFKEQFTADGFGLKEELRKRNYPLYQQVENDFERIYKELQVEPIVRVKVTGKGAIK